MVRLEDLKSGSRVTGIRGDEPVTLETIHPIGTDAVRITFRGSDGNIDERLLYRFDEPDLSILSNSMPWNFQADGDRFRLVSEAVRIRLAYLFDPYLAVHTSSVEPLPHQISAVYGTMLTKLPLRFILADDPGAGKTIMTGLFLKELYIRGDLKRCLIVCPGNLAEQWQEELYHKFNLRFEILTNEAMESAISGNVFSEKNFCIARLDKLARNELLQQKLQTTEWDLIVADEAHKMSASVWGNEVRYTRRFQLGRLLSGITRNFLLLTATPHNGKEEDFQLFLSLLDPDRFEGTQHGTHEKLDVSDIMRRLVKEELLKFDGTKLFPERLAYTVNYDLSPPEAELYDAVTEYVRNEFHNADGLDRSRRSTVGFALTILQRRLASSPEAIWQSLGRRRKRLEKKLEEFRQKRSAQPEMWEMTGNFGEDDFDEDDFTSDEMEELETDVADQASAAQTLAQLEVEIQTLKGLEEQANAVRMSGVDRKWDELSRLLQDDEKMRRPDGTHEKLILFTEHRDTLNYLSQKLTSLLGSQDAVTAIHGGMPREERHRAEELFKQNPEVRILLATDAAGEGINLQRAHLMINYDLPWNPNRLEQRFGRIHRIGQTEVCHLWNLVAKNTREGDVFQRLFAKLEEERAALGGRVFDILGKLTFDNKPLRDLLIEAIRYGNDPKRVSEFEKTVDNSLDRAELERLLNENALTEDFMDVSLVTKIREEMERREAYKLQPFFIESFFIEAFKQLGGSMLRRENGRWEIRAVPQCVKNCHVPGTSFKPIVSHYERVTFDKKYAGPQTELLCPGHPLLQAVISQTLERNRSLLKDGTVFIDENDPGTEPRLLFYIENVIQDGIVLSDGRQRVISRQLHFVEMKQDGTARNAGYAPYLDYRSARPHELPGIMDFLATQEWLKQNVEQRALDHAVTQMVPQNCQEIRTRRLARVEKITQAVQKRLRAEILYWDGRAWKLSNQEKEGKKNSKLNSENARRRADELEQRLERRLKELELEKRIAPLPPNVIGGALIIPAGLLSRLEGSAEQDAKPETFALNRSEIEKIAMNAVMEKERALGYVPRDVSAEHGPGYDIESWIPENLRKGTETLRFIEVKGRAAGAQTVTVSRNEILAGKNKGDQFILALVEVNESGPVVHYIPNPFRKEEPGFMVCSVNYDIQKLLSD